MKDGLDENKDVIQEKFMKEIVENVEEDSVEKNYIIPEKN